MTEFATQFFVKSHPSTGFRTLAIEPSRNGQRESRSTFTDMPFRTSLSGTPIGEFWQKGDGNRQPDAAGNFWSAVAELAR
jgi:hypothetical protein